jgi:hypothetical protein
MLKAKAAATRKQLPHTKKETKWKKYY